MFCFLSFPLRLLAAPVERRAESNSENGDHPNEEHQLTPRADDRYEHVDKEERHTGVIFEEQLVQLSARGDLPVVRGHRRAEFEKTIG